MPFRSNQHRSIIVIEPQNRRVLMENTANELKRSRNRRSFLSKGLVATGAATLGAGLLADASSLFADDGSAGALTKGDVAILRFLAAAEILETDLWQQYNELGGVQDDEVPGGSGNETYTEALETIDDDMPDYIHDNTDDEFTHFDFINAYLAAKGAEPVNL